MEIKCAARECSRYFCIGRTRSRSVGIDDLQLSPIRPKGGADAFSGTDSLEETEEKAIRAAMAKFGGNLSMVAKSLEISRPTLYAKLKKYNI